MKIDVEGSEADVVAGAHETLASDDLRAVLLEIHPELLEDVEEDIRSIYSVFVDRGYSCYRFRDHRSAESDPEILEISLSEVIDLDENEMLFFSRS
jgi:hypothetical protein